MLSPILLLEGDETYSDGSVNQWGWALYVAATTAAVIFNSFAVFFLHTNERLKRVFTSVLTKYLAIEDLLFSFICFSQCVANWADGGIFMGKYGCHFEAFQILFFVLSTGYTLALLAHALHTRIVSAFNRSTQWTSNRVFWAHIGIWIFSATLSILLTAYPEKPRLTESGTYCFVNFQRPLVIVGFFVIGIASVLTILATKYIGIFLFVKANSQNNSTAKQSKAAKKMFLFVVVYVLCYTPFLIGATYETTTGKRPHAVIDIMGAFLTHLNSMINPLLYFWTNETFRNEVYAYFGITRSQVVRLGPKKSGMYVSNGSDISIATTNRVAPASNISAMTEASSPGKSRFLSAAFSNPPSPNPPAVAKSNGAKSNGAKPNGAKPNGARLNGANSYKLRMVEP